MKQVLIAFAVLITCSSPALAQTPLAPFFNLPGAPVSGGVEDVSDYQQVLAFQNSRTADDCARATSEVKITLANFYGAPYGNLSDAEVNHWSSFINGLYVSASLTIGQAKATWSRPRPFVAHSDIHPCIKLESSTSYPSGHSALSELYARVLSVAFPERAADFKARALEIAHDRMVGGVHYPSDIRDGNLLGDQIFDHMNEDGSLVQRIQANE